MCFLVLYVLGKLLYPSLPAKELTFRHLSIRDGLSQSIVNCILQDRNGFMWFGTYNGLNKYDGRRFTIYQNSDRNSGSLSHNNVHSLYEDRDGVLWVGTEGGLNRFNPESETFTRFLNDPGDFTSLSGDYVTVLHEDRKGALWIGTYVGELNKFDRTTGAFTRYEVCGDCPGWNAILCLFEDSQGFLWIGMGNGLKRFDPGTETVNRFFKTDTSKPNAFTTTILSLLEDRRGDYWIGTGKGLYRFSPGTGAINLIELGSETASARGGLVIRALYEVSDGIIWIGTYNNGLFLLDPVTLQHIHCRVKQDSPGSLNHSRVMCIYEDSSGLTWVGTGGGGLNVYDGRKSGFRHFRGTPGRTDCLNNNSIWAIQEDSLGRLWIGTRGGGVNCIDRRTGKYTFYKEKENDPSTLNSNDVTSILQDHQGTIWIGTSRGVSRFNPERNNFTRFLHDKKNHWESRNFRVIRVLEDREKTLWIATEGALNRFDRQSETFSHFKYDAGNSRSTSSRHINEMYQGRDGTLWVGTVYGLNKFDKKDGSFTRFTAAPGCTGCLSANDVRAIHEDRAGMIWIGTNNGGLNRLNPGDGTFKYYGIEEGLPGNTVYCILEDDHENLWLSTDRGISRFTPATGYFCNFDFNDGLQCYEYNSRSGYKSPEGELFFGGLYGFVSFFPDQINVNRYVPPVVITGVDIIDSTNGSEHKPGKIYYPGKKEIQLSYKDRVFAVNFAALDYSQPEKNQYKYKMEGINSKWIPLGTTPGVTFSNLSPGSYVLRVRGSNSSGIWNNAGAALTIYIEPPFWKTWWFKLLGLILVVALFYSWHRWRMNAFRLKLKTEEEMAVFFKKYNISNREKEVMNLILKGKSNKQIEDELYISSKTVTSHIYNIYKKLEVKNRVEMIRKVKGVL